MLNLSEQEIIDLTGKRQHAAQAKQLRFLGIDFRPRADGSLVVSREHFQNSFGGIAQKPVKPRNEPNWNAA